MTDQLPVNEVSGGIDGASRKVLECGRAEKEGCWSGASGGDDTNSRIGVESLDDGIHEDNGIGFRHFYNPGLEAVDSIGTFGY